MVEEVEKEVKLVGANQPDYLLHQQLYHQPLIQQYPHYQNHPHKHHILQFLLFH
jgi:hypothetical protein